MKSNYSIWQECMPVKLEFSLFKYGQLMLAIDRAYVTRLNVDILEREFAALLDGANDKVVHVPGRGIVRWLALPSGEELIFRLAKRGGAIRHLLRCSFIRLPGMLWSNTRQFSELAILSKLYESDHPVPRPVAAMIFQKYGGIVYCGAVITEVIPDTKNLLAHCREIAGGDNKKISRDKFEVLSKMVFSAGTAAKNLLEAGVYHPDLHLGNVLVNGNSQVFIIDFDKAQRINPQAGIDGYAHKLATRWRRSVLRHASLFGGNEKEIERVFVAGLFGAKKIHV